MQTEGFTKNPSPVSTIEEQSSFTDKCKTAASTLLVILIFHILTPPTPLPSLFMSPAHYTQTESGPRTH